MAGIHRWAYLLTALGLALIAVLGQAAEECVDYTPLRTSGVGGWLLHGDLGAAIRLWTSDKSGLEFCFLAPAGGGRPWVLGKSLHRLIDTCYLDGYFSLAGGVPIGGSIDWQLIDLSVGLEFNLPDLSEFTFMLEVGVSLIHYYHCGYWSCSWNWRSQGVSGVGFAYYF